MDSSVYPLKGLGLLCDVATQKMREEMDLLHPGRWVVDKKKLKRGKCGRKWYLLHPGRWVVDKKKVEKRKMREEMVFAAPDSGG
jgi:hypothetical protein